MSTNHLRDLTDDQIDAIDAACSLLEDTWHRGEPASIEQQLLTADSDIREPLLLELVAAEVEARRSCGELPDASEYVSRFPSYSRQVAQAFNFAGDVDQPTDATQDVATDDTAERFPAGAGSATAGVESLPRRFGRYELRQLLGRGGMGSVYLAHDQELDRAVAIKFPEFDDRPDVRTHAIARFRREARVMATLSHPNLCAVHDVGEHEGRHYLTMAYVDGRTLAETSLSLSEILRVVSVMADAIHAAHAAGVVHRDLKPSNVMIDSNGQPIIMDFGLASRDAEFESDITQQGTIIGSPAYMAPEQVEARHDDIGPQSDVYALGVILYELLCGRRPYEGAGLAVLGQITSRQPIPPPSTFADVSPELDGVCRKAIASDLDVRYRTAAQFREALVQVRDGNGTVRPGPSRGLKSAVWIAGALLLVAAVGFGFQRLFNEQDKIAVVGAAVCNYDFSSASFRVLEGNATRRSERVTLTRNDAGLAESVRVELVGDTAAAGSDFTAGPVTVHFAEGQSTVPVPIEVLGDTTVEYDESLQLILTEFSGSGQAGTTQPTASFTIQADDAFVDFGALTGQSSGVVTASETDITLVSADSIADSAGHVFASTVTADTQAFRDRFPGMSVVEPLIFPALRLEDGGHTDVALTFSERLPAGASLIVVDLDGHARYTIHIDGRPPVAVPEQIQTRQAGGEVFPSYDSEHGQLTALGVPSNDEGTIFDLSGASSLRIVSGGSGGYTRVALFFPVFNREHESSSPGFESEEHTSPAGPGLRQESIPDPAIVASDLRLVRILDGADSSTASLVVTSDGNTIVSGHTDGTLRMWDTATEDAPRTVAFATEVSALAASPGGNRIAVGTDAQAGIKIVDRNSGDILRTVTRELGLVTGIDWSPDGRWLVACDLQGNALAWDMQRDEEVGRLTTDAGVMASVNFSADSSRVMIGGNESGLTVWATPEFNVVCNVPEGYLYSAMSPDGRFMTALGKLYDPANGQLIAATGIYGHPADILFSPDSRLVALCPTWNSVVVAKVDGEPSAHDVNVVASIELNTDGTSVLAFSPDGRQLITAGGRRFEDSAWAETGDYAIRVWELPSSVVPPEMTDDDSTSPQADSGFPPGSAADLFTSAEYEWTEPEWVVFEGRDDGHETTSPFVSFDGREIYFRTWSKPDQRFELHVSRRENAGEPWGMPRPLEIPIGNPSAQTGPALSRDGLGLLFSSEREGGLGLYDIWMAQRDSVHSQFGNPVNLGPHVNSDETDSNPRLTADGLTLVFCSHRSAGRGLADVWMCRRDSVESPFGPASNLKEVNTPGGDELFALSADGTVLLLSGQGIRMHTRRTTTEPFGKPIAMMPKLEGHLVRGCALSADSRTLYFACQLGGLRRCQIWLSRLVQITQ